MKNENDCLSFPAKRLSKYKTLFKKINRVAVWKEHVLIPFAF